LSNARETSVGFLFLIVHAEPIAHALPAELKCLTQFLLLIRFQNPFDPVLAARKNSFRFAQIHCPQICQLIIDLLQNRPDFLFLV